MSAIEDAIKVLNYYHESKESESAQQSIITTTVLRVLEGGKFFLNTASEAFKSQIDANLIDPDEPPLLTQKERKDICKDHLIKQAKAIQTAEAEEDKEIVATKIELIYDLGKVARRAQKGGMKTSLLFRACHAARNRLIVEIKKEEQFKRAIKDGIAKYDEAFKIEMEGRKKRHGFSIDVTRALFKLCDLGHEDYIILAGDRHSLERPKNVDPINMPYNPKLPPQEESQSQLHPWMLPYYSLDYYDKFWEEEKANIEKTHSVNEVQTPNNKTVFSMFHQQRLLTSSSGPPLLQTNHADSPHSLANNTENEEETDNTATHPQSDPPRRSRKLSRSPDE